MVLTKISYEIAVTTVFNGYDGCIICRILRWQLLNLYIKSHHLTYKTCCYSDFHCYSGQSISTSYDHFNPLNIVVSYFWLLNWHKG